MCNIYEYTIFEVKLKANRDWLKHMLKYINI